ncbi:MAG: hypothetical protein MUF87_14925 [Anaerolineae bacterium]|jgi:hypothetical protein|nr:hypothetical protein [Anaerolineae bacterium]
MTRPVRNLMLLLAISYLCISFTLSQAPVPYTPILNTFGYILNVRWSEDSQTLSFQEIYPPHFSVQGPDPFDDSTKWYNVTINTSAQHEVNKSSQPPFNPTLQQALARLPVAMDDDGERGMIILSPDQRYVVYAAQDFIEGEQHFPLAITEIATGWTGMTEEIFISSPSVLARIYQLNWSADSSAFVVDFNTGFGDDRKFHVTGYASDRDEIAQKLIVTRISELNFNGRTIYAGVGVTGISSDGNRLLLDVIFRQGEYNLMIWDLHDTSQSQVIVYGGEMANFISADFVNEDQEVLYIDPTGLWQYDLTTDALKLLDESINSSWVDYAWFSPNGRWMALLDREALFNVRSFLYILPVRQ